MCYIFLTAAVTKFVSTVKHQAEDEKTNNFSTRAELLSLVLLLSKLETSKTQDNSRLFNDAGIYPNGIIHVLESNKYRDNDAVSSDLHVESNKYIRSRKLNKSIQMSIKPEQLILSDECNRENSVTCIKATSPLSHVHDVHSGYNVNTNISFQNEHDFASNNKSSTLGGQCLSCTDTYTESFVPSSCLECRKGEFSDSISDDGYSSEENWERVEIKLPRDDILPPIPSKIHQYSCVPQRLLHNNTNGRLSHKAHSLTLVEKGVCHTQYGIAKSINLQQRSDSSLRHAGFRDSLSIVSPTPQPSNNFNTAGSSSSGQTNSSQTYESYNFNYTQPYNPDHAVEHHYSSLNETSNTSYGSNIDNDYESISSFYEEFDKEGGESGEEGDNESNANEDEYDRSSEGGREEDGDSSGGSGGGSGSYSGGGSGDNGEGDGSNDDGESDNSRKSESKSNSKKKKKKDQQATEDSAEESDVPNLSVREMVNQFEKRSPAYMRKDFNTRDIDKKMKSRTPTGIVNPNDTARLMKVTKTRSPEGNYSHYVFDHPRNTIIGNQNMPVDSQQTFRPREKPIHHKMPQNKTESAIAVVQKTEKATRERKVKRVGSKTNTSTETGIPTQTEKSISCFQGFAEEMEEPQRYTSSASIVLNSNEASSNLLECSNGLTNKTKAPSKKKRRKTLPMDSRDKNNESDYDISRRREARHRSKRREMNKISAGLSPLSTSVALGTDNSFESPATATYYSATPTESLLRFNFDSQSPPIAHRSIEKNLLIERMLQQQQQHDIPFETSPEYYAHNVSFSEIPNRHGVFIFDSMNDETDNQTTISKSVTLVVPESAPPKRKLKKKKRPQEIHSDTSEVNYPASSLELSLPVRPRNNKDKAKASKDARDEQREKNTPKRSKSKDSKVSSSTPISISSHYYEDEKTIEMNALRNDIKKQAAQNEPEENEKSNKNAKQKLIRTKERFVKFIKGELNSLKTHIANTQESYYGTKASNDEIEEPSPPKRHESLDARDDEKSQAALLTSTSPYKTVENTDRKKKRKKKKNDKNVSLDRLHDETVTQKPTRRRRRTVETESLGIQTDEELTGDELHVRKHRRKKTSDYQDEQREIIYYGKSSNHSQRRKSTVSEDLDVRESRSQEKKKREIKKNSNAEKSSPYPEQIKYYDFQEVPKSASQTFETTSVVTNTSSVRVKRKRRSMSKSTFATQTDDELSMNFKFIDSDKKSLVSESTFKSKESLNDTIHSLPNEPYFLAVDRSLKPKPKPGPKPIPSVIESMASPKNTYRIGSDSRVYTNIPAALFYHDLEKNADDFTTEENLETESTQVKDDSPINENESTIKEKTSYESNFPDDQTTEPDNTRNPTIFIEPETEEDYLSDDDSKVNRRKEKCEKDKGKLGDKTASKDNFRKSFERRGKRSRYRASQRKREFDIERYGERLIRALEDCLRKGELSKEVSEDAKDREYDASSRISSQYSKSDDKPHYEIDDATPSKPTAVATDEPEEEKNENSICLLKSNESPLQEIDRTDKELCISSDDIPENTPSVSNVCIVSESLKNDISKYAVDAEENSLDVPEEEIAKLDLDSISMNEETNDTTCSTEQEASDENQEGIRPVKKRNVTLKRWVSEPSVLPDEGSYEFREYKRDLVKALLLIHKQSSKNVVGELNEDSLSFDSITRELGSDFDLYFADGPISDDQETRTRSPLVRQDAVEYKETAHDTESAGVQESSNSFRRPVPLGKFVVKSDISVDTIDDLEMSGGDDDDENHFDDEDNQSECSEGNSKSSIDSRCSEDESCNEGSSAEVGACNKNYTRDLSTDDKSRVSDLSIRYASEVLSESEAALCYEPQSFSVMKNETTVPSTNVEMVLDGEVPLRSASVDEGVFIPPQSLQSSLEVKGMLSPSNSKTDSIDGTAFLGVDCFFRPVKDSFEIDASMPVKSENEVSTVPSPVVHIPSSECSTMKSSIKDKPGSVPATVETTDSDSSSSKERRKTSWLNVLSKQPCIVDTSLNSPDTNSKDSSGSPAVEEKNTDLSGNSIHSVYKAELENTEMSYSNKIIESDSSLITTSPEDVDSTNYFAMSRQETSRLLDGNKSSKSSKETESNSSKHNSDETPDAPDKIIKSEQSSDVSVESSVNVTKIEKNEQHSESLTHSDDEQVSYLVAETSNDHAEFKSSQDSDLSSSNVIKPNMSDSARELTTMEDQSCETLPIADIPVVENDQTQNSHSVKEDDTQSTTFTTVVLGETCNNIFTDNSSSVCQVESASDLNHRNGSEPILSTDIVTSHSVPQVDEVCSTVVSPISSSPPSTLTSTTASHNASGSTTPGLVTSPVNVNEDSAAQRKIGSVRTRERRRRKKKIQMRYKEENDSSKSQHDETRIAPEIRRHSSGSTNRGYHSKTYTNRSIINDNSKFKGTAVTHDKMKCHFPDKQQLKPHSKNSPPKPPTPMPGYDRDKISTALPSECIKSEPIKDPINIEMPSNSRSAEKFCEHLDMTVVSAEKNYPFEAELGMLKNLDDNSVRANAEYSTGVEEDCDNNGYNDSTKLREDEGAGDL